VTRPPPASLERYVDAIWFARGWISYRSERIAPTGSTVAIVGLGSPIRQIPDDRRDVLHRGRVLAGRV
jgi:hypothetical protein